MLLFFGLLAIALFYPFSRPLAREVIGILSVDTVVHFYSCIARACAGFMNSALSILGSLLLVYLLIRSFTLHPHSMQIP